MRACRVEVSVSVDERPGQGDSGPDPGPRSGEAVPMGPASPRSRRMSARAVVIALSLLCLALRAQAGPTRYEPRRAGHPLRIAAYAAPPFGGILDTLIVHPAWGLGQHEPLRTLFGVTTPTDDD